ncbi:flagellar filament capping protein FliD [Marinomonas fungiae]|uniref:Flagellar hook-associated protein 2 n=1 Tax=Marinomonas fungiae TaxID=1137284 RepID=A0A0K6IIF5_9GAMM|nr:flagellar filament capping protein FliD [Marinomonas fungiae]CUB02889.1 Flagellar capping protein FliD [Marinomonas fungiae]
MSIGGTLGVASGLALEDLVTQLVSAERTPKASQLDSQKRTVDVSLSALSKIRSALGEFQGSLDILKSADKLMQRAATVSHPDDLTPFDVTTSGAASAGSYNITVEALASGTRATSVDGSFAGSDSVVSTTDGILTFGADGNSFDVEVTAGMTLSQLREAINSKSDNFGVSANIINTGDPAVGSKLVITSSITGDPATKELSITNNNAELDTVSTVASGGGAAMSTVSAQQAHIKIDGVDAYSDSNTMENVIQNVSLDLKSVTNGTAATLDVSTDKETVRGYIDDFIENYNKLMSAIEDETKSGTLSDDGETFSGGGALNGNSMIRGLRDQMASDIIGSVGTADPTLNTLFALGISIDEDGKMEISSTNAYGGPTGEDRLNAALDGSFDKISSLFSGDSGIATRMESSLEYYTQSKGLFDSQEEVLKSQLESITQRREDLDQYISGYEETLRKRYAALDSVVAQMYQTSSYLMSQLSSLPGFGSSGS